MNKAGDLLKDFFAFCNIEGGEKYVALFSSWRKIAGDDIAAHSRIFNLHRGALIVEVDHPGWAQRLRMQQSGILQKLSTNYPDLGIRMIHIKLVADRQFSLPQTKDETPADTMYHPSPKAETSPRGEVSAGEELAGLENIQDAKLKELLLRLKDSLNKKKKVRKRR
jgi:hypothetical protein